MPKSNIKPRIDTYTLFIKYYLSKNDEVSAKNMMDEAISLGLQPNVVTFTTWIDYYATKGDTMECNKVFEEMRSKQVPPNCYTYSALMKGCAAAKKYHDVKELWEDMNSRKVRPNEAIYDVMISASAAGNDLDQALTFMDMNNQDGFLLLDKTYNELLRCATKLQRLSEVEERIKKIKVAESPHTKILY